MLQNTRVTAFTTVQNLLGPVLNTWTHENYIVIGDFNAEVDNTVMSGFCSMFDLPSLINEPTCYKNHFTKYEVFH